MTEPTPPPPPMEPESGSDGSLTMAQVTAAIRALEPSYSAVSPIVGSLCETHVLAANRGILAALVDISLSRQTGAAEQGKTASYAYAQVFATEAGQLDATCIRMLMQVDFLSRVTDAPMVAVAADALIGATQLLMVHLATTEGSSGELAGAWATQRTDKALAVLIAAVTALGALVSERAGE